MNIRHRYEGPEMEFARAVKAAVLGAIAVGVLLLAAGTHGGAGMVGDATAAAALVHALGEARCFAVRRGSDVVDVLTPRSGGGEAQARVELGFFLRAWAVDYPSASPRVA